jgi:probable phosphomutase (TIGR03848 family)
MATLLLVRHGRTTANTAGVLAGWTAGVELDETGRAQAEAISPLLRCRQTAELALAARAGAAPAGRAGEPPQPEADDDLGECRYGDWTGKTLRELAKDPLWRTVQAHPSAVTFPGEAGESMVTMQARAVAAVRRHDAAVTGAAGADAIWLAVSHGDVIKAVLADALGMHLDAFQRLVVDPASVSVIRYTPLRPFVERINDSGADLDRLVPQRPKRRRSPRRSSDAELGGGAGHPPAGANP